jgi:hypothetical protein
MTDREKALAYFRHREAQIPMPGARAMYQEAIKAPEQPTIEPERKRGKWIDNETSYADGVRQTCTCSICGQRSVRPLGRFCRWCGADVGGDKDDQR